MENGMLEILQNLKNCEMIWNMCVILSINVCMHVFCWGGQTWVWQRHTGSWKIRLTNFSIFKEREVEGLRDNDNDHYEKFRNLT